MIMQTFDKKVSNLPNVKTCVHCVFGAGQPHGDVYARISETVAAKKNRVVPVVPHVVRNRKILGDNLRSSLGIPREATVFGRYGGRDTFDIGYVKTQIKKVLNSESDSSRNITSLCRCRWRWRLRRRRRCLGFCGSGST